MLNLHGLVRGVITSVNPDETVSWYRATGQQNIRGQIKSGYAVPVELAAQVQSAGDDALYHAGKVGENSITRHIYLFSPSGDASRVAGLVHPATRTGDMIYRKSDATWWLVTAVVEDFSSVGWEKVRVTLQINPPEGVVDVPS